MLLLPDSTSSYEQSMGAVTCTILPKTGLPDGTQITNRAAIYFDFNAPVIPGTTLRIINSATGIEKKPGSMDLLIYPNPVSEKLTIALKNLQTDAYTEAEIFDLQGRRLYQKAGFLEDNTFTLETGSLTAGFYVGHLKVNGSCHTFRFVKAR
jgi:hypothetical protein